jgi:hypothetical protein
MERRGGVSPRVAAGSPATRNPREITTKKGVLSEVQDNRKPNGPTASRMSAAPRHQHTTKKELCWPPVVSESTC